MLVLSKKEFDQKVSASISAISLIFVTISLFLMRCLIVEDWFFPAILQIIFHNVVVLVDEFNWFT